MIAALRDARLRGRAAVTRMARDPLLARASRRSPGAARAARAARRPLDARGHRLRRAARHRGRASAAAQCAAGRRSPMPCRRCRAWRCSASCCRCRCSGGIGSRTAIVALTLYALLPILRTTITGITGIDRSVRDAGIALGMTPRQLLWQVELPLAIPSIVSGVRIAAVVAVGSATIAAAVGAGGLGEYIYRGLAMVDTTVILAGAIPAAALALLVDLALWWAQRRSTRRHARRTLRGPLAVAATCGAARARRPGASLAWRATDVVVVGSKNFAEQLVLGEIVAQAHRARRRRARRSPAQPRWHADLRSRPARGRHRRLRRVHRHGVDRRVRPAARHVARRGHAARCAISTRAAAARCCRRSASTTPSPCSCAAPTLAPAGCASIDDAAREAPRWRAAFGYEFLDRPDGYAGLARAYGIRLAEPPTSMDLSLTYRALASGRWT